MKLKDTIFSTLDGSLPALLTPSSKAGKITSLHLSNELACESVIKPSPNSPAGPCHFRADSRDVNLHFCSGASVEINLAGFEVLAVKIKIALAFPHFPDQLDALHEPFHPLVPRRPAEEGGFVHGLPSSHREDKSAWIHVVQRGSGLSDNQGMVPRSNGSGDVRS